MGSVFITAAAMQFRNKQKFGRNITRVLLSACLPTLAPVAMADSAEWIGTDSPWGAWHDPANWENGFVGNDPDTYIYFNNLGTAYLGPGETATGREAHVGSSGAGINGGGLILDHATLDVRGLKLYGNASLVLDNAEIVSSVPNSNTGISTNSVTSTTIDILSGSYTLYAISLGNNTFGEPHGTDLFTVHDGVDLNLSYLYIGDRTSDSTYTQTGGTLSVSQRAAVGHTVDGRGEINLTNTTVDSGKLVLGFVHTNDPIYDGFGTVNQTGGIWSTGEMELTENGVYHLKGGQLHVDTLLHGGGTLDFHDQASSLTFGQFAQFDLRNLTVLNSGATSISGGESGVLRVNPGYDPNAHFGSFNFGGLVLEDGAPVHIQAGQTISLSGIFDAPFLIEGSLSYSGPGLYLKGPTTIRGNVDLLTPDSADSALIVDGHTTVMESGTAKFFAIVGDGSALSRLELNGGVIEDGRVTIRSINGGVAEVILDGTQVTDPYFGILMSGDGTSDEGGRFIARSGTLHVGNINMGYTNMMPSEAGLSQVFAIEGGTSELIVEQDADIIFAPMSGVNYRNFYVGVLGGNGIVTQHGGTIDASTAQTYLGRSLGTSGVYHLHGGHLQTSSLLVGYQGDGHFYHNAGTVHIEGELRLAYDSRADGLYRINGGSLTAHRIMVSSYGTGTFEHNAGRVETSLLYIGEYTQTQGAAEYHLNDGVLEADEVMIGRRLSTGGQSSTRGKFIQSGGVADIGLMTSRIQSSIHLLGGQTTINRGLVLDYSTLDFEGGDHTLHIASGAYANFSTGAIRGSSNATITADANTLISFAAGFNINQIGTFSSLGLVHIGGQELVIPQGSAISAAGDFDGGVTNNGTFAPGSSPGQINISGGFSQSSLAELVIEIGDPDTVGSDLILASGSVSLDGHLSVLLYDGFMPDAGDYFPLIIASDMSGGFNNLEDDRVYFSGGSFSLVYNPNNDTLWLADFQPGLYGDLNHDDQIDQADLSLLLTHWGKQGYHGDLGAGDLTGDGVTDQRDLLYVLRNWTSTSEPVLTIPEPSGLSALAVGLALALRRRPSI